MTRKQSPLRTFSPFLSGDGLIRIGSRILYADINDEAKYPVILPRKDRNVKALILSTHINHHHAGPKTTLSILRQTVWILQGLQAVKEVIHRCVECKKRHGLPLTQKMAPLPRFRISEGKAFQDTGVDLLGPIGCKMNGRATHKVWIVLFTCMRIRAIHTEIVFGLDADSLLHAIRCFCVRRPGVQTFHSDQGTNLTKADKTIKSQLMLWNKSCAEHLRMKGIDWNLIAPRSPHVGGVWERMVSLVKRHLAHQGSSEPLHIRALQTLVVEIEGIVNRRPLTPSSDNPDDFEALTPAHLLYPGASLHSSNNILPSTSTNAETLRNSWIRVQARVNAFWLHWKRDYITLLHQRKKWLNTERDLQVDDLVIMVEDNVHRGDWRMARVINIYSDGAHVRKADIKTAEGKMFQRDRTKLILLELDWED